MAGTNSIEAKLKIAADFADAVRQLQALRAEMKGAAADARGVGAGGSTAAAAQAQKETATAARTAAAERTRVAREATEAEKQAARDAAEEHRRQRRAEVEAAREAARELKRLAREKAAAEREAARASNAAARQLANQQRQLAPQVTDIVTGLAGGQNPLLVAIQQGGQLRDIMGGTGNAVRALMSLFTPMRVALIGVVGVASLFGKAFFDAKGDVDELNRSIASTGNTAATTSGQVQQLARQIATQQRASVGEVRETLNALLQTGRVTSTTMEVAARATTAFSKATGASASDARKLVTDLIEGGAAAAAKANQQYNFLTAAQYERIRALQAEGKQQEAVRVALEAFSDTMTSRVVPSTNSLERAWQGLGRRISEVWESWKGFFNDATQEGQIAAARKRVTELEKALASNANLGSLRQRMRAELDALREGLNEQERLAIADQNARNARAALSQKNQEEIAKSQKGYQDALASVDAAGAQKRLAIELAALERRRSEIELAHKRGLTGELEYSLQLNAVEQQRLQAQAANLERQIQIEAGRAVEKPEDGLAKQARVQALEAQLVEIRSNIQRLVEDSKGIVEADALATAREGAAEWARTWQRAAEFVKGLTRQNSADAAATGASGDPAAQARAAGEARTQALRQQTEELERALKLQLKLELPAGQRAEIEQQLADLARESATAIEGAGRRAQLESLRDQAAALQASLRERESDIDRAQAEGAITSAEAERQLLDLRAEQVPQLEKILALMEALATTDSERANLARLRKEVDGLKNTSTELERTMRGSVASSFSQAFSDVATGAKTAGQAFRDFVKGVAQSALNLIAQRLGEQLAKSLVPSGSGGSTSNGGWGQLIADIFAGLFHGGGVVGGLHGMSRAVSPMVFATAARYHGGGIAGLAPDEVPAVLLKGEEVLTEDDPRHRNNGGGKVIENLQIGVTVNTGGATGDAQRLGDGLGRVVRGAVAQYVQEEMRPGGLLAGRR